MPDKQPVIFPDLGLINNKTNYYLYKILDTKDISGGLIEYTIILFPEFNNSIGRKTGDKLLSMFLEAAGLFLEPIDKCASKMIGQYYPRLNKDGRFYIDTIQDNCHVLYETINRFKQYCQIVNQRENKTEINITDIVTRAIDEYQNIRSDLKIKLENSGQIFLMADANKIAETLNAIFIGLESQTAANHNPVISLKVTSETKCCNLQISYCGKLGNNFDPENALEPLTLIKEIPSSGLTVFESELPVARLLVESIGGEMTLSQTGKDEININLKFPSDK